MPIPFIGIYYDKGGGKSVNFKSPHRGIGKWEL